MRWRGTLALLAAVVLAATWLYRDIARDRPDTGWQTLFEMPQPTPPALLVTHLLAFDPAQVSAVTLRRGAHTWRTERTAGGWSDVEDPRAIDEFLRALTQLAEILPIDVTPALLADHGLAPPRAAIELARRDGAPIVVLVGGHNPPSTGIYVQLGNGGPVALTGALLTWDLDKAERALRGPP